MINISHILIVLILILIFNVYFYDKYTIKKSYKKNFKFNSLDYKYYTLYTRLITIFNSSSRCVSILDKFNISENDSFLDVGSGDGLNLLHVNNKYNFGSIYGVEIDKSVYESSLYNINLIDSRKIKIYNNDATKFTIPINVNYIYLFNPFAKVFYKKKIDQDELNKYKKVIENIKKSYDKKPRKINIIFTNIKPDSDKNHEILKLFNKNFEIQEQGKLFMNMILRIDYAIYTLS